MNASENTKLYIGIAIGLVAAVILGVIAFHAGQNSVAVSGDKYVNSNPAPLAAPTDTMEVGEMTDTTPKAETLPAGQIKVSGTFSQGGNEMVPDLLSFGVSGSVSGLPKNAYFVFTNANLAYDLLKIASAGKLSYPGCNVISGKADIIISGYKPADTTLSESAPTAKIISVSKITSPATCSRGNK